MYKKDLQNVPAQDDEEFPEILIEDLPSEPMSTEIADLADLPKIKVIENTPENRCKSPRPM
ncbi:MAG: hypothetical protein ACK521_09550 [bacterium]|jgi:hypothetical protein